MKDQTWLAGTARERIQDLAKAKKVSQVKLAEATGINRSKISRFISGASDSLSHEDIIKIAHYFKVSTDFLLGETDAPDRKNYDIEELGLSVKAAKRLYTGIVNPQIVCQLLEHEKCPELMQKIEMFQEGIEAAGIAAKLAGEMEQVNIHRVDTQILRRRLMEEGAFLPKLPTDTF